MAPIDEPTETPATAAARAAAAAAAAYQQKPDPSALTAVAVGQAKEDLRRELLTLRALLEARIGAIEEIVELHRQEIAGMPDTVRDAASALHIEIDRRLRALDTEDQSIRREISAEVQHLADVHAEKFASVEQRFRLRDERLAGDALQAKEALAAALAAAKESVSQQNAANTKATEKTETNFTKQLEQIGTLIETLKSALGDQITALKERIDRGEGGVQGTSDAFKLLIGVSGAVLTLISIIVVAAVSTHGFR